ncbi:hypothetical protein [Acidimangrovimonas pyrenivorans]|uniref:Uncharacterized protein n=1 Tax=Acidimangrovimonas pyrenivorans TaxID=2030798 RepID=A0ABV7ALI0_9RHOB
MLELECSHSHLYPGARGRVLAGAPGDGRATDGPVTLAFADGGRAQGTLSGDRLSLRPHLTAAGTRVAARAWRIAFEPGAPGFRITARLAEAGG